MKTLTRSQQELYEELIHETWLYPTSKAELQRARALERHGLATVELEGKHTIVTVTPIRIPFKPSAVTGVIKLAPVLYTARKKRKR